MILAYCRSHPWIPLSTGVQPNFANEPTSCTNDRHRKPRARTHERALVCVWVCVWMCVCYLRFSFFIIHCKESSSSILEGFSFLLFYLLHCLTFFQSLSLFLCSSVFLFWADVFFVAPWMRVCVYCVCNCIFDFCGISSEINLFKLFFLVHFYQFQLRVFDINLSVIINH